MRPSGRGADELRPVSLEPGVAKHAEGSCLVKFGETHVLCAATIEDKPPSFLRGTGLGWVTAEYGMLPRATHSRTRREAKVGQQTGRSQEIQRLIGRSLRIVADRVALGERQIVIDCDVLQADGGTRTAAITGGYVALYQAAQKLLDAKDVKHLPMDGEVAAISCGVYRGQPVLDLDYAEDSDCEADANFVITGDGRLVEVQATAEGRGLQRRRAAGNARAREKGDQRADRGATRGSGALMSAPRRLSSGGKLVVASHNPGKLREIGDLLAPYGLEAVSAAALGLPEPEETETTFIGNARLKAHAAATAAELPALSDDSGLSVDALGGDPGIYSARWAGPEKDFAAAMRIVWDKLDAAGAAEPRRARFVCALCLAWPDGADAVFEGVVEGRLVWPPRGDLGFGYDPMFVADDIAASDGDHTFGEIAPREEARHQPPGARLHGVQGLMPADSVIDAPREGVARMWFARLIALAAIGACGALLIGFLSPFHAIGDSFSSFRIYFAAAALGSAALLAAIGRRRYAWTPLACALAALLSLGPAAPYLGPPASIAAPSSEIKLLQLNLNHHNAELDLVERRILAEAPHVVTFQEVSELTAEIVDRLRPRYPHMVRCRYTGVGAVAVMSRLPAAPTVAGDGCRRKEGLAWLTAEIDGRRVSFASIHLRWPFPFRQRPQVDRLQAPLAAIAAESVLVIGGDFNATPWTDAVSRIAAAARTRVAPGLRWTWRGTPHPLIPPFAMPIDHVMVPESVEIWGVKVGAHAGSDHLPVIARLAF